MHLLLWDVLVRFVSVRLHRSCGVRGMGSRYLASGATRDGGQKWAGVGWELSQEGEELSSEHLHHGPLGVSAGGISLPEQLGSRIDDCPKGGMEKSHRILLGPPFPLALSGIFACSAVCFSFPSSVLLPPLMALLQPLCCWLGLSQEI